MTNRRESPAPDVVVITGASAGIGRALARAYGARGSSVGLIARGRDGLEAARREIEDAGGMALDCQADVANAEELEQAAAMIEERFGPPDVWVNNAMVSVFSPVQEMKPEEFRRVTEVTYLGVVNGTLAALRRMTPRNRGRIVQVGSALAYRGIPLQSAYCAANIIGNKIAPSLGDRYLANVGYEAQQTQEPEDPDRPHNLWMPVSGDHGAHGRFDSIARTSSPQAWLSTHRDTVAIALATVAFSIGAIVFGLRGRTRDRMAENRAF